MTLVSLAIRAVVLSCLAVRPELGYAQPPTAPAGSGIVAESTALDAKQLRGPLIETGRPEVSIEGARRVGQAPRAKASCVGAVLAGTLGGAAVGATVGLGAWVAGSKGGGQMLGRATLIGAGAGLVVGAIACTR